MGGAALSLANEDGVEVSDDVEEVIEMTREAMMEEVELFSYSKFDPFGSRLSVAIKGAVPLSHWLTMVAFLSAHTW